MVSSSPRFPSALPMGGTIGLVAASRWPDPIWIKKATAVLKKRGFKVVVHPVCYQSMGRLAGTDFARAGAVMDMFLDPAIDAILCVRGGTGASRMVDLLDFRQIAKHPKPFVGFSDVTVLLNAIAKKSGFVTFHGPMGWNMAHPHHPRTLDDLLAVITTSKKSQTLHYDEIDVVRAGAAQGRLVGGNLCLLQSLIGTPYEWDAKGGILFIEDVEEHLYAIDRALQHLRLAGKFDGVKAVIVGEMVGMIDGEDDGVPYGLSLRQVVEAVIPPRIPLCYNFPCGHGKYLTTLPLGAKAKVTMTRGGKVSVQFSR